MKATKENIINYIINKENEEFHNLVYLEKTLGIDAEETAKARSGWSSYYQIIKEFNLIDKLEEKAN